MLKGKVSVSSKVDKRKELKDIVRNFSGMEVFVGIPEGDVGGHVGITNAELLYIQSHGVRSKEMREEMDQYMGLTPGGMPVMRDFNTFLERQSDGMTYSQAYELFIHENGSPLWHIPPRPVLEPAIQHNREMIANQLKDAAKVALDGNDPTNALQKAGMAGVNAAKDWFVNPENRWPENAPSTIERKGSDKPLIDTSNLRNSLTFVVKKS